MKEAGGCRIDEQVRVEGSKDAIGVVKGWPGHLPALGQTHLDEWVGLRGSLDPGTSQEALYPADVPPKLVDGKPEMV